ncbi:MAG: PDGLE domain-containing protein [Candidatus Margulisiibacteriota bacterium]|jgi:hypothetical protein
MKKSLLFTALILILAALFASQSPDGLDKTAQILGFAGKGAETKSLMTGYAIPFITSPTIATILAGVAGVMLIIVLFLIVRRGLKF